MAEGKDLTEAISALYEQSIEVTKKIEKLAEYVKVKLRTCDNVKEDQASSKCEGYYNKYDNACRKEHPCGHKCGGIAGEENCLPCLLGCECAGLMQSGNDLCMICYTEPLSCAPALQLMCGHIFHAECSRLVLTWRWPDTRISFTFAHCPICKEPMFHPALGDLLKPIRELLEDVKRKAVTRLEFEGRCKDELLDTCYNDKAAYAMDLYSYYMCFKCNRAYYGGEGRCDVEMAKFDPRELVCAECSDVARAQMCSKHGLDFLEYKCRFCCSVAVYFCFGSTHSCNGCHGRNIIIPCPSGPGCSKLNGKCPLNVEHPPNGTEFSLGCAACHNAHLF